MKTHYETPFKEPEGFTRLYLRDPDGIHWTFICPTCGKTGRSEGRHRAVRNLANHARKTHRS